MKTMAKKIVAVIPARMSASRFPGKLMQLLNNKPVIVHTYEAVRDSRLFNEVYVACDHEDIRNAILNAGGKVIMSLRQHESGSDRIAEAVLQIDCDIVVNVQGDEPFIDAISLQKVIALFDNEAVEIASLMMPIQDPEKINNPNCVKVVTAINGRALYFSRSPIPFHSDLTRSLTCFQHIGVYAFKKETLLKVTSLPQSELEKTEKLENLRMLENGFDIYLASVEHTGIAIDTPQDLERARAYMESLPIENKI
jgi:3-deoxy-manno-octulosonate cytidylyltransferase (CMP-KDO synthetase)